MTTFLLLHAPFQRKDKGMAGKNRKDHRGRVLPPNVSQKADKRYIWRKMIDGRKYVLTDNDLNELKKKKSSRKNQSFRMAYTARTSGSRSMNGSTNGLICIRAT